jgi:hypothetical protein
MSDSIDKRPYFFVYGDTAKTSFEQRGGGYRTFDEAKVKADALLASGHILVHIRRAESLLESWIVDDLVVWAAASPKVDWR